MIMETKLKLEVSPFNNVVHKWSVIIPLLIALSRGIAAEPSHSSVLQQANDRLLSAKVFAFGRVADYGQPCTTSEGEQSFRTLAESTNGLPLFIAAMTNGTTAAKLYALCGIRHLAPEQFETLAAPFTRSLESFTRANSQVVVAVGTIKMVLSTSTLIEQIKNGAYEDFCPQPLDKKDP